jgi:hypothetical protein
MLTGIVLRRSEPAFEPVAAIARKVVNDHFNSM